MSDNYGKSFDYLLAESVPARDGRCNVELPDVNVGDVDVDFITAVRSMPGGIIRIEEIGGAAYTLTALSPEQGGCFNITGATGLTEVKGEPTLGISQNGEDRNVYDIQGRKFHNFNEGFYIVNGKKIFIK
jgi:hypothetical protein